MRMRAAVMYGQGKPRPYAESVALVVQEVELDPPGPGEVLVRLGAAGLCHSDLSVIEGLQTRPLPIVAGHEGAGEVVEVGEGVTNLSIGDHVVMVFVASCGRCAACVSGATNLCQASWGAREQGTLRSGARRLHRDGIALNHWSGSSSFAEYAVTSVDSLVRIPTEIPLEDAALFGCSVLTGVGAVVNTAHPPVGSRIAVLGLGGVGLSAILGAVLAGAGTIIAIDVSPEKLALASELGATLTIDARDPDVVERVHEATQGGVDFAFEMSGAQAAADNGYAMTRRGGTLVMASLPDPRVTLDISVREHVFNEHKLLGSYMGSSVAARDIPRLADLYLAGRLPVHRLRSESLALDDINRGFDRLADGEAVRDVVTFV